MSYDGGLDIEIANKVLLEILQNYQKKGLFSDATGISEWIGKEYGREKLALSYEYLDCAYISACPKTIEGVLDTTIELIDFYAEGYVDLALYRSFKEDLYANRELINNSYKFVKWAYHHGSDENEDVEIFQFKNKKTQYRIAKS